MPQDLLVPAGTRLLHIGPHKTGTTAVQGAFAAADERLGEYGVRYFGEVPGVRHLRGALAVTGRKALLGESQPNPQNWTRLVEAVAASRDERVLISSEFFADADDETARRVVTDLAPGVHVLVTLRPLARIIASQWQQYVQNGLRTSYKGWLEGMLDKPPYTAPTPTFWHRHRHDELVARWAAAAGPERVTVIVANESDPAMLLRTFESLLGLPEEFLVPVQSAQNRSLTYGEAELVRLFNEEFRRRQWPEDLYATYIREGAVRSMKAEYRPSTDEAGIPTPRWALDRVAEIGTNAAKAIAASGVRVIGDIGALGRIPAGSTDATDGPPPAPRLAAGAAAHAVLGVLAASHELDPETLRVQDRRVRDLTARELLGVMLRRGRRRLGRTLHRRSSGADGEPAAPLTDSSSG